MKHFSYLSFLLAASAAQAQAQAPSRPEAAPHIVLIMCDDMGYSDLGCYGSEIRTPHIDSLAANGLRFSHFLNTGRSCPSRASLLTGHYQHDVGMGWMTAVDEHRPGYRGQVCREVPTIAERMKEAGYMTYMAGKWHLTLEGAFGSPNGSYPVQRGFDRYYGCLSGGGSYRKPKPLYSGLNKIDSLPDDYYYTVALTDSAIKFVRQHPHDVPMFLYVAHYAPHLPLEAPAARIEQCLARYKCGYDELRSRRFERQKLLGLMPYGSEMPIHDREFDGRRPAWDELTEVQQNEWIRSMATYAAMIEIVDEQVGRLIDVIRAEGMLDNTVFIFLSDNGASNEGGYIGQLMADLSNTPYRSYKQWCYYGGTASPLILAYGGAAVGSGQGKVCTDMAHIIDIVPTCLDLAGIYSPDNNYGLPGVSLMDAVVGTGLGGRTFYFEHQGSSAVISDGWKLVRRGKDAPWELIELCRDPFEMYDVSVEHPDVAKHLQSLWNEWAKDHKVLPLEDKPWTERIEYYKRLNPDQSGIE